MNSIDNPAVLLPALLPFATALGVLATRARPFVRDCVTVGGSLATCLSVLSLVPAVRAGGRCSCSLFTLYPGIEIAFVLDALGMLFAVTASLLWVAASFYCIGYMRSLQEHAQVRFYVCYAVAVGAALGVASSGTLLTLYLLYEVVTIFTYPLVMHHQDREGYAGARKYIVYLMFASKAFLLPALAIVYIHCGTLEFSFGSIRGGIFPAGTGALLMCGTFVLFLLGFAKAAVMPLHGWLPSAMVAPTPVSALLHAVVVVKVGVFSICRVMLSVYGTDALGDYGLATVAGYAASFTILAASIVAMTKTDLKARLAYSTVSQLSYIILGVAMLSPDGITGGLVHIPNHAFAKITLFFCAGAILAATGIKDIRSMGGLGYRMPFTMGAFGVASLSMIGVPPVGGFVSKWFLGVGTLAVSPVFLGVLLLSSLLNAVYFGEIFVRAFFGTPPEGGISLNKREREPLMLLMLLPFLATALISVAGGLYPEFFLNIIAQVTAP